MSDRRRFRDQPHHSGRGKVGEADAERWLVGQGYRVIERNVTLRGGEIDLVARDGETLCFVEIKARAGDLYGPAIASVTAQKQRRLARAAARWLSRHPWPGPCRFDVLAMDLEGERWRFQLVRDAFQLPFGGL